MSSMGLQALPECLGKITTIKTLEIQDNAFASFPEPILKLT